MGIILFFIRDRYGLPYSILLHFSNNLLAIVVNNLSQGSTLIQGIYSLFLLAGLGYGIYYVVKTRKGLAEDRQYEKEHSLSLKQFLFFSPLMGRYRPDGGTSLCEPLRPHGCRSDVKINEYNFCAYRSGIRGNLSPWVLSEKRIP